MRHLLLFAILSAPILHAQTLSSKVTKEELTQKQATYHERLHRLNTFRKTQAAIFIKANNVRKKQILQKTRTHLETEFINHLFPAWYGTAWDFNGTSKEPGKGKIACGYFVSTCLTQAGFRAPRIKLAQQASQKIIGTFMPRKDYKVMVGNSMDAVRRQLKKSGNGLYIVGLDRHVGFVFVHGEKMTFIHSSYYSPDKVVKAEPIDSRNPLRDSNYRVFGKIFSDAMLTKWLKGQRFTVG